MRLTLYSEYGLRTLIYLGLNPERLCAAGEIAEAYGISTSHLTKVVHALGKAGIVTTVRGRGGGLRLSRPAEEIRLGGVIRALETGLGAPDCGDCPLEPLCALGDIQEEAVCAFVAVFDRYSVADLIAPGEKLKALFTAA